MSPVGFSARHAITARRLASALLAGAGLCAALGTTAALSSTTPASSGSRPAATAITTSRAVAVGAHAQIVAEPPGTASRSASSPKAGGSKPCGQNRNRPCSPSPSCADDETSGSLVSDQLHQPELGCPVDGVIDNLDFICPPEPLGTSQGFCLPSPGVAPASAGDTREGGHSGLSQAATAEPAGANRCSLTSPATPLSGSSCEFDATAYDDFQVSASGSWTVTVQRTDATVVYSDRDYNGCFLDGNGATGTRIVWCSGQIHPLDHVVASLDSAGALNIGTVCSVDPLCTPPPGAVLAWRR